MGRSRSGKSNFIEELVLKRRINPPPEKVCLFSPTDSQAERFEDLLDALAVSYDYLTEEDVLVPETVKEGRTWLANLPKEIPKLIIMDDMITFSCGKDVTEATAVDGHHFNALLICSAQYTFTRNLRQSRENSDTKVLFSGFSSTDTYKTVLRGFPEQVVQRTLSILSTECQEVMDFAPCEECELRTPVIIHATHKSFQVYKGLDDYEPFECDCMKESKMPPDERVKKKFKRRKCQ